MTAHAIENARGKLDDIIELYEECHSPFEKTPRENIEAIYQRVYEMPLSVRVRSGWKETGKLLKPLEFEILLSTGGPACAIFGKLDEYSEPDEVAIYYQDWYTNWEILPEGQTVEANRALMWYATLIVFTS